MDWQVCLGYLWILVIVVIMWGASQGWYSKKIAKIEEKAQENTEALKDELDALRKKIFDQQLEIDAKNAKIAELTRQVQDLMNSINVLTTRLQTAEAQNARLRQALKNTLDDLEKTRAQLQECRAKLLAKQIVSEKCQMTPETANLIR